MEQKDARSSNCLNTLRDVSMGIIDKHKPPLPPVLYHYTTTEGLLNIIPKNQIWSTDVRYFNDWMELRYALHKIGDIFLNRMNVDPVDKLTQFIFDAIGPMTVVKYSLQRSRFHFHATCFSTEGDDLYQWRAYSQATEGYAIGFRAEDLQNFDICNVIYEEDQQVQIVKELVLSWRQTLKEFVEEQYWTNYQGKRTLCQGLRSVICALALQFKDRRFAAEREWRIVGDMLCKDVMYRKGHVGLTPYVCLDMASMNSSKMPIVSVTQGPRVQSELEAEALAGFLSRYGYEGVEVKRSQVSVRF